MIRRVLLDSGAFQKALTQRTVRRFWKKVDRKGLGHCWNWLGHYDLSNGGYGSFWFVDTMYRAHRFSWMFFFDEVLSEETQVLHHCDNPRCVNPFHLFLGTNQENMDDKVSKGRQSRLKGENNPWSKLSDGDVIRMRRMYKTRKYFQKDLARIFKLKDVGNVGEILRGKRYSHLNEIEPPIQPFQCVIGRKRKEVSCD